MRVFPYLCTRYRLKVKRRSSKGNPSSLKEGQVVTEFDRRLNRRRDGRVVDYTGLENRRTERCRGFESLSLRSWNLKPADLSADFHIHNTPVVDCILLARVPVKIACTLLYFKKVYCQICINYYSVANLTDSSINHTALFYTRSSCRTTPEQVT